MLAQDEMPVAEQTAIASDCIRECTAYLKQLTETYASVIKTQITQAETFEELSKINGWEYDNTELILGCMETLTNSIANIIDRLPVGERKPT